MQFNHYMVWFAAIVVGSFLIAFFARMMPMRRLNPLGEPLPNFLGFILPAAAFGIFSGLLLLLAGLFIQITAVIGVNRFRFSLNRLHPAGMVDFRGMGAEVMYYKELLDKLGVDMQLIRPDKIADLVQHFIRLPSGRCQNGRICRHTVYGVIVVYIFDRFDVGVVYDQFHF